MLEFLNPTRPSPGIKTTTIKVKQTPRPRAHKNVCLPGRSSHSGQQFIGILPKDVILLGIRTVSRTSLCLPRSNQCLMPLRNTVSRFLLIMRSLMPSHSNQPFTNVPRRLDHEQQQHSGSVQQQNSLRLLLTSSDRKGDWRIGAT